MLSGAKNALWRDITQNTTRETLGLVDKFVKDNVPRTSLRIDVDETQFVVDVRRENTSYKHDGEVVTQEKFRELIDTYVYGAKTVCHRTVKAHKINRGMPPNRVVAELAPIIRNLQVSGHLVIEVLKERTFVTATIDRTDQNDVYRLEINTHIITDAYDEFGGIDNVLLDLIVEETLPITEEHVRTSSMRRVTDVIRRVLKTTEPYAGIVMKVGESYKECSLNLDGRLRDVRFIVHQGFRVPQTTIDDRERFENARDHTFHHELMEVAWHPDRYIDWCLDEEERKRTESYRHNGLYPGVDY